LQAYILLPFEKYDKIVINFELIKNLFKTRFNDTNTIDFLNYLERMYVGSDIKYPVFKPVNWSVHERVLRGEPITTNIV
jgi:hypothetical protein